MRDMLEQSIERLLSSAVDAELLIKAEDEGLWAADLWTMVEEAGFTYALVPEEAGGAGATWADVFTLFRAAGRYAAPIPFGETVVANWLMAKAGLDIPEGPTTIATPDLTLSEGKASGRLTGAAWGRHARHILVVAGGTPTAMLFDRAALQLAAGLNVGREPCDEVILEGIAPVASAPLPDGLHADALLRGGALVRSAQMAGALQHLLDLSLRYAEERSQFGRPIAKFQAIQHQLAVLAEHTSLALIAADAAFAFADDGLPETPVASAKIIAGEAATAGAAIAHAVHGAIGVTYEHSLHFTTRRLWAWRSEFGSERYWSERLGRSIASRPAGQLWTDLSTPLNQANP